MADFPVLYSFRRCPYAIRARLAVAASRETVELREIVLRDKASEFLAVSPSATVPCLRVGERVIDESLDIMFWALERSDPEGWLTPPHSDVNTMLDLIGSCDGPFKKHLDRYKYDTRYADANREEERASASDFVWKLEDRLKSGPCLYGETASLADFAILPFVRQFANTDRSWFEAQGWEAVKTWLSAFEGSGRFQAVMHKWRKWQAGDNPVFFPDRG